MVFYIVMAVIIIFYAYQRYAPVLGVHKVTEDLMLDKECILDLRDYQTTAKEPINNSINIPYAYLKRFYKEIPTNKLMIIATDSVEKNLAIRFLVRKKFKVTGYLIKEEWSEKPWIMTNRQKTG
ncbi:MAG: hypothetical protein AB2392_05905 [Neobacillus sp.]|jgi:hypothetical protein